MYVDLLWRLFLIGHVYLSGIHATLEVKYAYCTSNVGIKDMHALQVHVKLDSVPNMLQGPKLP